MRLLDYILDRKKRGVAVWRDLERLDLYHVIVAWRSARSGDVWYMGPGSNAFQRIPDGTSATFYLSVE